MTPPLETIRLSQAAKDRLIQIKRRTGVDNWNILCRWALCMSLTRKTEPERTPSSKKSEVEIPWKTFSGIHEQTFAALIIERAHSAGRLADLAEYFEVHLERGIAYLLRRTAATEHPALYALMEELSDAKI